MHFALSIPFRQLLLVFGGALARCGFFAFDLRHLRFQLRFRRLNVPFPDFRVDHQLQNFVFVSADILLGKLNFVHQRLILIVGFYFED